MICRQKWKALYACVLTERDQESSSQRASALLDVKCASLCVKTCVCNQTVIIKDKETNGDAACHVGTSKLQYVFTQGFSNSSTNNVFVAHLPQATVLDAHGIQIT